MNTLYLLQGNYQQSLATLHQLNAMLDTQDGVVLLGEAVLAYLDILPNLTQTIYILDEEYQHLNTHAQNHLNAQVISFDGLADLVLHYQRCVRLV